MKRYPLTSILPLVVAGAVIVQSARPDCPPPYDPACPPAIDPAYIPPQCPCVRYTPWSFLSDWQRSKAYELGYDQKTWNYEKGKTADVEELYFKALSPSEQAAAISLGYDPESWTCCLNHYEYHHWGHMGWRNPQAQAAWAVLGYNRKAWNQPWLDIAPESENKDWCPEENNNDFDASTCLSDEETYALSKVCYTRSSYQKKELGPDYEKPPECLDYATMDTSKSPPPYTADEAMQALEQRSSFNCLPTKGSLRVGQSLESNNGLYFARLETDGRLCRYRRVLPFDYASDANIVADWCTNNKAACTDGNVTPDQMKMQVGGMLTIRGRFNEACWAAGSEVANFAENQGYAILRNDGNLAIFDGGNDTDIWSCNTEDVNRCELDPIVEGPDGDTCDYYTGQPNE